MYADDAQCIMETDGKPTTCASLQSDLNSLCMWSNIWNMSFNHLKSVHMRFGTSLANNDSTYSLNNCPVQLKSSHSNVGILLTSTLSWSPHISSILSKAYRPLGLIRRTVPYVSAVNLKKSLYLTLVRCHFAYCLQIWQPYLTQDSRSIERLQHKATRYILFSDMDYKSRLANLSLLPLTLWLESLDVLLLIKLLKNPPDNFNIKEYITLTSSRLSCSKLKLNSPQIPRLNPTCHFYINRIVRLWNILPPLDLELPFSALKEEVRLIFWDYFISSYSIDHPCTWYISCPCTTCIVNHPQA